MPSYPCPETPGANVLPLPLEIRCDEAQWALANHDREGWLYLAVVIDLFARRVVGWATGDRLHRDLALAALRKALTMRRPG